MILEVTRCAEFESEIHSSRNPIAGPATNENRVRRKHIFLGYRDAENRSSRRRPTSRCCRGRQSLENRSSETLVSILVILTIFHVQIFEYLTHQDLGSVFIRSLKNLTARYSRILSYEILGSDLIFSYSLRSVSE